MFIICSTAYTVSLFDRILPTQTLVSSPVYASEEYDANNADEVLAKPSETSRLS